MSQDLFSHAESKGDTAPKEKTNAPEYSVSDLALSLKKTLEDTFGRVRVRGELSRVKIHTSGHMYSDLKDVNAVINVVCWKGQLAKIDIQPEEGLEVIVTGRVTTFPARSNYQLVIEKMELAGEGALLKMLEERKKKLTAEGLFEASRKKPLPFLPKRIGVVTSETGAVIQDILHRVQDRFPCHVLLWPVPVQGQNATAKITQAIAGFNAIKDKAYRPDILIVGRGGGSLEDLMAFNEEDVVRAIAQSDIPIIAAIGHETDTTLADHAADKRAPTPTGAAEMALPERLALKAHIEDSNMRLFNALRRIGGDLKNRLEAVSAKLSNPAQLLDIQTQNLDHLSDKLQSRLSSFLDISGSRLRETGLKLKHPEQIINESQQRVHHLSQRLELRENALFEKPTARLEQADRLLETLSFKSILKRGYTVVRDENNTPITHIEGLKDGQLYELEFAGNKRKKIKPA